MAQMFCGTSPEEVRDEIATWLQWHADRFNTAANKATRGSTYQHHMRSIGDELLVRAQELREIPPAPNDEHAEVERGARALLERRGFGFYIDPMEGGQNAYDLSLEAMDEVRIVLAAVRGKP